LVKRSSVTIWQLRNVPGVPLSGLLSPNGLWVCGDGKEIWCTLYHTQFMPKVPLLVRLNPATGACTLWAKTFGPLWINFFGGVGIVGDDPRWPKKIWFAYSDPLIQNALYCYELNTGQFLMFPVPGSGFGDVRIAQQLPWIGDSAGNARS
jgi:hypothetical protein